jgi:hypothetical protein
MTQVLIEKGKWRWAYLVIIERNGERTYIGGRRTLHAAEMLRLETLAFVKKLEVR